jgi:Uri superfamily endonuclease
MPEYLLQPCVTCKHRFALVGIPHDSATTIGNPGGRFGPAVGERMTKLPASVGTYALLLHLARKKRVRVGRLGTFTFERGDYVYVGSAFGPGGLRSRLERHLRQRKRKHWHIDVLLAHAQVRGIIYATAREPLEHRWSQAASQMPGATVPVKGFGAGDCHERCAAHLIRLDPKTPYCTTTVPAMSTPPLSPWNSQW